MSHDSDNYQASEGEAQDLGNTGEDHHVRKRRTLAVLAIAGVLGLTAGVVYYVHQKAYESTDNAFIDGSIIQVSPRVAGQVLRVQARDNQHVKAGDLLLEIDPSDYETRLAQARAQLEDVIARASGAQSALAVTSTVTDAGLVQARAALEAARAQVAVLGRRLVQEQAGVRAAEANLQQAEAKRAAATAEAERAGADASRYRALFQKDEVSKQQLERAEADGRASAANLEAAEQLMAAAKAQQSQAEAGVQAMRATVGQAEMMVRQAEGRLQEAQSAPQQVRLRETEIQAVRAQVEQARAAVRQAELNLSYTRVYAVEAGYITKKSVEEGNFVQTGQALVGLVPDRLWVVANFKETQLALMRPGQPVTIKVDAYPKLKLRGRVDSIQSGSGARFSMLPPENATGNYVKVIQRVPVKIVIEGPLPQEYKLGPGMSVVPEVKVQ